MQILHPAKWSEITKPQKLDPVKLCTFTLFNVLGILAKLKKNVIFRDIEQLVKLLTSFSLWIISNV